VAEGGVVLATSRIGEIQGVGVTIERPCSKPVLVLAAAVAGAFRPRWALVTEIADRLGPSPLGLPGRA
jgi:hypothetical protein